MKHRPVPAYLETLTALYLGGMLTVFLLFPGLGGYQNLTTNKASLFYLLSGGYLALSLLLTVELALVDGQKLPTPKAVWQQLGLPEKLILAYWLLTGLSTALSIDPATAFWGSTRMEGFVTISLYCWCLLFVCHWGKPASWMLWLFGGAMSLNCLLALLQLTGANPLGLYPQGMTYFDGGKLYSGEFLGTIGNVDLLSAVLCIAIPVFATAIIKLTNRQKWLLLIPLALCLTVLLRAFVAGGVVGILGCALLFAPVLPREKALRKKLALLAVLLIVAGLVVVYLFGSQLGGFLGEASTLLHGRWDDSFGSGRLFIWRNVIELVPQRLLTGGGPDTLGLRVDAAFERYDEDLGVLIRSTIDSAHNEYLHILVNQGLPALLTYLAALLLTAYHTFREAASSPVTAICGAGVLGYCIQAFFGVSSPISTPFLWLTFALLLANLKKKTI